jgi:glycerol-3-phosphate dehydrogenase
VIAHGPRRLDELPQKTWDIIVIGGGVTGAGILDLAVGQGFSCLLLERRDFASGTSSKTGKLVHGGIRYLKQGQFKTTWHSVRERERLLKAYPGLIEPLPFLYPLRRGSRTGRLLIEIGLTIYDLMAGRTDHRYLSRDDLLKMTPDLDREAIRGGFIFHDALTDDARLVLRVLDSGRRRGGVALNYVEVKDFLSTADSQVRGVAARDVLTGAEAEISGRVVISAAGAWTDEVRRPLGHRPRLRKLRGSHLLFPAEKFPLAAAVGLTGPEDGRSMYALPWEGVTLMGTTDLDHDQSLDEEPTITAVEGDYLLTTIRHWFPDLDLSESDAISTTAGIRPVIDTGKKDPSKESRDHVVWAENGLVTITGGKLTTFGLLAGDALEAARSWLDNPSPQKSEAKGDDAPEEPKNLDPGAWHRLEFRYGPSSVDLLGEAAPGDLATVPGTDALWAELAWAAGHEDVRHLDDLLLRRVRVGLLLPEGGADFLDRVQEVAGPALGWDEDRWRQERERYDRLWRQHFSPELIRP